MARRKQSLWQRRLKDFRKITRTKRFAKRYCMAAFVLLGLSTVFWSLIGGIIESQNADQLANIFLLHNSATINGALLPAQHTFLLKVPLFWVVGLFGATPAAFVIATVVLSLLTVGGFAFILSRIEKRPLVLGTIVFALAAVLMYIPAQSYPGSLLPSNFAMLTTRNIEYVLFIGAIILVLKAHRLRSGLFNGGAAAFALLFASDQLFVSLGAGAAVISGLLFVIRKRRDLAIIPLRLLIGVVIGYFGALLIEFILTRAGLHFGGSANPYGLVAGPKDFVIGLVYGILGIFTNLGANPAFDAVTIKDIPARLLGGIVSPFGPGYIATIGVAIFAIRAAIGSVKTTLTLPARRVKASDWHALLPVVLIAATLTALITFVASNHYYPADSRYLSIALFAGFIAIPSAFKGRLKPQKVAGLGIICLVATIFGVFFQLQNLSAQNTTMNTVSTRDQLVTEALKTHPVGTLLGNYWRVLPIKLTSPSLTVTPLQNCTTPRQILSSTAWQPNLATTPFAYVLRLDGSLADYPNCSLKQVTDAYGQPDSSVVIAGSRANSKELLLFYDSGIYHLQSAISSDLTDTVTPVSIDSLPDTTCATQTVMQFVAHEDDDILFMNPDLQHAIDAGDCVRTVYFTAGDAGSDRLYWLGRQHGAEAAYAQMLGTPNISWTERVATLDANHIVTVASPRNDPKISLIFFHLPDGSTDGSGFASEHFESLKKLYAREIPAMNPVDDPSDSYSYDDLTGGLIHLMQVYKPSELHTQSTDAGTTYRDHSDHSVVGEFTTLAFGAYQTINSDATLTYYLGYPVHGMPANVTGDDYTRKVATFLAFGQYDAATCQTLAQCNDDSVYGIYLRRQYTSPF